MEIAKRVVLGSAVLSVGILGSMAPNANATGREVGPQPTGAWGWVCSKMGHLIGPMGCGWKKPADPEVVRQQVVFKR